MVVAAPFTGGASIPAAGAVIAAETATGPFIFILGPLTIVLGAEEISDRKYSFDCWKPVLHDESTEPSKGMILHDVVNDKRIKDVTLVPGIEEDTEMLILENIWDEKFRVEYVELHDGQIAAHAVRICNSIHMINS